jgi:hypothetical protein
MTDAELRYCRVPEGPLELDRERLVRDLVTGVTNAYWLVVAIQDDPSLVGVRLPKLATSRTIVSLARFILQSLQAVGHEGPVKTSS